MKKVFLIIVILTFSLNIFSFTWVNDLECILAETQSKSAVSENLINGSLHYLKSKSYADLLLYEYEKSALQTFNFSVGLDYIDKAVHELESAKIRYSEAIKIGSKISYNENKTNWFKTFDYDGFIENNNLNKEIAQEVKNYLISCDVLGIYQRCIDKIDEILNTLYSLKERVKSEKHPEITIIWKLFQQYSETSLFGNYATVMGTNILRVYE